MSRSPTRRVSSERHFVNNEKDQLAEIEENDRRMDSPEKLLKLKIQEVGADFSSSDESV